MKRNIGAFLVLLAVVFTWGCKGKGNEPDAQTAEKALVSNPWKLKTVTDLQGNEVPNNQLNFQTQAIYAMNIQFQANKVVKAFDDAGQASNGGTWSLLDENKTLDIAIVGFSGKFGVNQLSSSKMSLKNNVPVNGVNKEVYMNFDPVIK